MGYWLALSLVLALASLAAARYISSPRWIDALFATGAFVGLAAGLLTGWLLRRAVGRGWKPAAALILAIGAAAARSSLLVEAVVTPEPAPSLRFWRIALACSTVVWGALALLWGTLGVGEATQGRTRWGPLLLCSAAVILALYSLAPLWQLLGLRINHWTLLGLFGLACLAYLAGQVYRWLASRIDSRDH